MIQISINNGHRIIPVSWNQYDSDIEFDDQRKSYVGYNKHDEEILYKFDVIFADDTCEGECFMINPEKQGAYEIIMNETAEKWRINELNLTKEQIDQALQEKCNIKYSLEVKAYSKTEEYNSIAFYEIQNIYPIE